VCGQRWLPLILLWAAVVAYAWTFSVLTVTRLHAFEARALDMGNLHQTIWNTAQGDWFRITNQESGLTNRLGVPCRAHSAADRADLPALPNTGAAVGAAGGGGGVGALPVFAWHASAGWDWLGLLLRRRICSTRPFRRPTGWNFIR
jgi:hypothetical protein